MYDRRNRQSVRGITPRKFTPGKSQTRKTSLVDDDSRKREIGNRIRELREEGFDWTYESVTQDELAFHMHCSVEMIQLIEEGTWEDPACEELVEHIAKYFKVTFE